MKNQLIKQPFLLVFLTLFNVFCICSFSFVSHQFSFVVAQTSENTKVEADRLRKEGEQLYVQGQFVRASETLESAMTLYKEIGDEENYKEVLEQVHFLYYKIGAFEKLAKLMPEYSRANGYDEEIESTSEQEKTDRGLNPEVDSLILSGKSLIEKEDYDTARKYFNRALDKAQKIDGELEQIVVQTEIGTSYLYEGDYIKAISTFQIADNIAKTRYPGVENRIESYGDIRSESFTNIYREMIHNYIPFLQLFGEAYLQNNEPDKALIYFEKSEAITTQIKNQYQEEAVVARIFGEHFFTSHITTNDPNLYLSRANYRLENYQQALDYANKAIAKVKTSHKQNSQWYDSASVNLGVPNRGAGDGQGYALAGMALEQLGELDLAEENLRKAVEIFEATSNKSTFKGNINHSLKLFNNQVRAASVLQRVLIAQNKPEEALAAAEWGRGKLLLETANSPNLNEMTLEGKVDAYVKMLLVGDRCQIARVTTPHFNPPPQINKPVVTVPEVNISHARRPGEDSSTSSSPEEIMKKVFPLQYSQQQRIENCDNEAQIEKIRQATLADARKNPEQFEQKFSEYLKLNPTINITSNTESPTIGQLKQVAQSQQATIVEYSFISDSTYFHGSRSDNASRNVFPGDKQTLLIWVIQPTGEIQYRQIDLKAKNVNIGELVTNTRRGTHTRVRAGVEVKKNGESINGSSREIAEEQLKQLYQLLIEPINELLPSDPEAQIVFVPHQELFLIPFTALIDTTGKYLIEKHTITTAPSILTLELTSQKKQLTHENQTALVIGNPIIPPIPDNQPPIQLVPLEYAEQEGNEVARILNTQSLTGNQATESKVIESLPNAQYIHLAIHGLLDDYTGFGIPGTIVLASSEQDDGFLSASVIQEMDLSAELAVLSACDTGIGDITGDGVVGLSRAFMIAGVPSVVVSLWKVDDAATGQLMVEFYRNFRELNIDKARALRKAMLEVMKTHPDPYYWAAFTLIGED